MSASPPLRLVVVRHADGWLILGEKGRLGRYAYRVDAEEAALRLARKARAQGREARIWVQDLSGRLEGLEAA